LPQFSDIRWWEKSDTLVFKKTSYKYKEEGYFDFTLDSISPARGIAEPNIASQFPFDLNGNNRLEDNAPDAGAYEWKPTQLN
jgi:hypothetical protein